jgi:hypothetical protein
MRWARRATLGVWLSGFGSMGLAWGQARWYAFHPHYLPLCLLYLAMVVSTLLGLVCGFWRIVRGPQRTQAMILFVVTIIPVGFWANVGITAQRNFQQRWQPNTFTMNVAKVMGVTFMRAAVDLKYCDRLETNRLVMFYNDLNTPEQDLAAMDQHLARLEELLGGRMTPKVFWIRGSLPRIGVSWLSVHGMSFGSDFSPEAIEQYRGDRHELAHAALDRFRVPGSDPPCLLHEGWAMAQCGDGSVELAQEAANERRKNPWVGVRELLGPAWYHRDVGPVYSIGGAFVDFLIRTRGAMRFRRFYVECQPQALDAKCLEIFETDIDDLEAEFWKDVEKVLEQPDMDQRKSHN